MMDHNCKAVIAEDGRTIDFYVDGEPWWAAPRGSGEWTAVDPRGIPGFGLSIWAAVEDSKERRARELAEGYPS